MQATPIGVAAGILEDETGGVVFIGGNAAYSWAPGETLPRRLAAIHLAEMRIAPKDEVAAAFGVTRATLWRWERTRREGGWEAVGRVCRRGPKGPSKLTPQLVAAIKLLDHEGCSLRQIAERTGVSTDSVRRALGRDGTAHGTETTTPAETAEEEEEEVGGELPTVPLPEPRMEERRLARFGQLQEAPPVFTQGRELPLLGLLLVLPALAEVGLLEAAEGVYGKLRNGFYGLRSLLLMLTFLCLLREPRAEGATRLSPTDLGRLLGLDRAPEVKSIRRRLNELCARGKEGAVELLRRLALRHAEVRREALGFLYLDGHMTVYSGKRRLPKAHITRLRISAPASADLWVSDAQGDPVFVVAQPPGSSMVKDIRALLPELQRLAAGRRLTICFDRGGWSPELFCDIVNAGFDFLTYRKGRSDALPKEAFHEMKGEVDGREVTFQLADRPLQVEVTGGQGKGTLLALRQVVRLVDEHQTAIVTSRTDLSAVVIAARMFFRWRQENWFKYARTHFALDAMDSYSMVDDDPQRMVPNPLRTRLRRELRSANSKLTQLQADNSELGLPREQRVALETELRGTRATVQELEERLAQTPARVPLVEVEPEAQLPLAERRLLAHAVRMSTFNAESALARLLAPFYRRADDEARSLLREAFRLSGDLRIVDGHLEVTLNPLSAPRRTAALAELCRLLTDTETTYPGTGLVLRYAVKHAGRVE